MMRNNNSIKQDASINAWKSLTSPNLLRLLLVIAGFFIGGLVLCGCGSNEPQARKKLAVGVSKSFLSIPVYIAQESGVFSEEALDVTLKEYPSGKMAIEALFAGEVDLSTVADMPIVLNSFKRHDFCLLTSFTQSFQMVKIITRKDAGIKKGDDLRGKKVGANPGTSSHFFLAVFLLHNGLEMNDIKMVPIKTVDLPDALKNNQVDAISVWKPYDQKAIRLLENNALELPSSEIYRTTFSFAAMKDFVEPHLETMKRFLRAIDRAVTFAIKNRQKAQGIIAASFNLDENRVSGIWNDFAFRLTLDQSLLISWDEIARWAIENKLTDKKEIPNYLNYICPEALDAIKPEADTIIH
ncbi:MAG: NrtA/SsuA/CpmA family ABC transporter substrate-binding protein [Deltaproteobacteria bacterium]|nr:NrtA/SsuA/CpmA family ABC transporter substrate-binding protein [Deltaproteobacteria bacterium]